MPRITLDLNNAEDCRKIKGQWRVGHGLVPGQPNEGLTAQLLNTPARLPDYDDSGWEICANIRKSISKGFTFAWYRITVELPKKSTASMSPVFASGLKPTSITMARCGSTAGSTAPPG